MNRSHNYRVGEKGDVLCKECRFSILHEVGPRMIKRFYCRKSVVLRVSVSKGGTCDFAKRRVFGGNKKNGAELQKGRS